MPSSSGISQIEFNCGKKKKRRKNRLTFSTIRELKRSKMNQRKLIQKVTSISELEVGDLDNSEGRSSQSISRVNTHLDSNDRNSQRTQEDVIVPQN